MAKKILIVDDEQDWIDLLTMRLEHEGYSVTAALNGLDGMKEAVELKPDLILLDITMPVRDGVSMLGDIRSNPKTFNIPVILVTVKTESFVKTIEKSGFSGYHRKFNDIKGLMEKIKEALRD